MRIVFFGSAPIAFPSLERLIASAEDEVVRVVTQPDRPAGRYRRLTPCPVKSFALERGLTVSSPEKPGDAVAELASLHPDLFVVVAYGTYLPHSLLTIPPHGSINLHPSLLPAYRGASPIQHALANGDTVTGVTVLYVSRKMDAGDLLLQQQVPIDPDATAADLEPVLAERGAALLMDAIQQIRDGTVTAVPQDESAATEVRKLTREDGRIDWRLPAETIRNRIRGYTPWPGCFCEVDSPSGRQRLKVLRAAVEPAKGEPGTLLRTGGKGPLVACGHDALCLCQVQPQGKRPMTGADWLRGHPLEAGVRLDSPGA